MGARPRLVSLLPVRNGAPYLPRHLASASVYADAIVALDDGSNDDTRELLDDDPLVKVILANPSRPSYRGWDDAANRNRLLEAASELNPEWVLFLDADESIPSDDGDALRSFLHCDAIAGLAYGLVHHRMWGDVEYDEETRWIYRLFAWRPGLQVPDRKLHFNPVPDTIRDGLWVRTTIRVQHFGSSSDRHLLGRRQKYGDADPDGRYGSDQAGMDDPPRRLVPWGPRPPGLAVLWAGADPNRPPTGGSAPGGMASGAAVMR